MEPPISKSIGNYIDIQDYFNQFIQQCWSFQSNLASAQMISNTIDQSTVRPKHYKVGITNSSTTTQNNWKRCSSYPGSFSGRKSKATQKCWGQRQSNNSEESTKGWRITTHILQIERHVVQQDETYHISKFPLTQQIGVDSYFYTAAGAMLCYDHPTVLAPH